MPGHKLFFGMNKAIYKKKSRAKFFLRLARYVRFLMDNPDVLPIALADEPLPHGRCTKRWEKDFDHNLPKYRLVARVHNNNMMILNWMY